MATALLPSSKKTSSSSKEAWHTWIIPAIVLLIITTATALVLIPQFQQLLADNRQIKQSREELTKLIAKRSFLQNLSVSILSTQQDSLERVLPSKKPVFTLIESFRILAQEQDVSIAEYTISPGLLGNTKTVTTESTTFSSVNEAVPGERAFLAVELDVDGTLENVLQFLSSFETLAPIITVDAINVAGDVDRDNNDIEISAKVTLAMNYAIPPTEITQDTEKIPPLTAEDLEIIETIDTYSTYADEAVLNQPIIEYDRSDIFSY